MGIFHFTGFASFSQLFLCCRLNTAGHCVLVRTSMLSRWSQSCNNRLHAVLQKWGLSFFFIILLQPETDGTRLAATAAQKVRLHSDAALPAASKIISLHQLSACAATARCLVWLYLGYPCSAGSERSQFTERCVTKAVLFLGPVRSTLWHVWCVCTSRCDVCAHQ